MNIKQEYKELVKYLDKNVFKTDKDTNDVQLNKVGKKTFGKDWGGIFAENEKIPLNTYKYFIVNTDKSNQPGTHWCAIYADHKSNIMYVFDSFDRQTSKLLHDVDLNAKQQHFTVRKGEHDIEQLDAQSDCGPRSMSWLILVKKYGIDAVKSAL
jgi:hypothetical protein